ncbi:hypothetical protein ACHAXR_008045, partial [Thalassiosira sp. AJA248-18]
SAEKRKTKALAHGPTVHALKRAKYEAKQERRRQALSLQQRQSLALPHASWFDGREEYAAFVTVEDVRDIRKLREGGDTTSLDNDEGRTARLRCIAVWIEPFFDLKEMPNADNEEERLFISEGTEAVRMMIQRSGICTASTVPSTTYLSNDTESPPPVRLVSILSKPAAFFDSPTHLLADVEKRSINGSSTMPFKIIIADEEALSEIAGFPIARGAMACGVVPNYMKNNGYSWLKKLLLGESLEIPTKINTAKQRQPIRRLLALDAISNAANMGSIVRTAAAFSIDAIILSDDSCDAWYRQSVRVSLGHVVTVPILRVADWERGLTNNNDDGYDNKGKGLGGVLFWLRDQMNVECIASVVDDDSDKDFPPLVTLETDQVCGTRSWCMVLGNEGHGIRDEVIRECEKRIRISMRGGVDSLSLPIAAGKWL